MSDQQEAAIVLPVVPARGHGTQFAFACLDCAGEGSLDVEATWEHADPERASLECWCDRHLPNNAVEVREGDESVGWFRLATVGRKVNSADSTSTPPRHLPPLPEGCYPPGSVPIPVRTDIGSNHEADQ